jgi:hypothetical protein
MCPVQFPDKSSVSCQRAIYSAVCAPIWFSSVALALWYPAVFIESIHQIIWVVGITVFSLRVLTVSLVQWSKSFGKKFEGPKTATRGDVNGSRKISFEIFGRCLKIIAKHKQVPETKLLKPTGDKNT